MDNSERKKYPNFERKNWPIPDEPGLHIEDFEDWYQGNMHAARQGKEHEDGAMAGWIAAMRFMNAAPQAGEVARLVTASTGVNPADAAPWSYRAGAVSRAEILAGELELTMQARSAPLVEEWWYRNWREVARLLRD